MEGREKENEFAWAAHLCSLDSAWAQKRGVAVGFPMSDRNFHHRLPGN